LLKANAQRRRTQAEIQREKLADAERLRDIASKMELVNDMERRMEEYKQQAAMV
jgi:hypothetical protein